MIDLKPTLGGVGKPAKEDRLHEGFPCRQDVFVLQLSCLGGPLQTSVAALLTRVPTPHIRAPNSAGLIPHVPIYRTGAVKIRA